MSPLVSKQKNDTLGSARNGKLSIPPKQDEEQHQSGHRTPQIWHAPYDGMQVTEEEYWAYYYESAPGEFDASYEWNNGILEAKPVANQIQANLYNWFFGILFQFVRVNRIAILMNLELGFRIEVDDPNNPGLKKLAVRKPDIGVILNENEIPWLPHERTYHGICDMVIESLSDSNEDEVKRDTVTKRQEYQDAGIREYFILDPSGENQHFYRLDKLGQYAKISPIYGIIHSEVLPGFQFRLSDFSQQPDMEDLVGDEVYEKYILPKYQATVKQLEVQRIHVKEADARAEEERQRAAEADARSEEERQRAAEANTRAKEAEALARQERQRREELEAFVAQMKSGKFDID
ncbi:MAG: Uma2 family endonuclease [Chloroflexota bacterium]